MKQKILHCAIRLFQEDGFSNVSVQRICEACQVTKGCFYHYYSSKEEVLLDYYASFNEDFGGIVAGILRYETYMDKLWNFYRVYVEKSLQLGPRLLCELIRTDMVRGSIHFTSDYGTPSEETKNFCALSEELGRLGQEAGEFTLLFKPEELRIMYTSAFIGVLADWSGGDGKFDPVERLEKIFRKLYGREQKDREK